MPGALQALVAGLQKPAGQAAGQQPTPSQPIPKGDVPLRERNDEDAPGGTPDKAGEEVVVILDPKGEAIDLKPFNTFSECPWPGALQQQISAAGFSKPSQIQAYAWPIALQGHDVIGVAKTGSGKTIAFLFPAFMHILNNNIPPKDPILLVLAPTRELACQIEKESQKFGTSSNIKTVCAYGGAPKGDQLRAMRNGIQCLIATPGRLNDFLETKAVNLSNVCKLCLDEADRMLDMGFEPQIRKILKEVPRTRHTMFFTATWPKEVRRLADDFLTNPYQVKVGETDCLKGNQDITQVLKLVDGQSKNSCLMKTLQDHGIGAPGGAGLAIVFSGTKRMCDDLERQLQRSGMMCAAIHGDKDQTQRDAALDGLRTGRLKCLVATDVAARGIDIKGVTLVVNYDPAGNPEDYVHRIGRTGRAGMKGTAVSFLTSYDGYKAKGIIEVMQKTNQVVDPEVQKLADNVPADKGDKGKGKGPRYSEGGQGRPGRSRSPGDKNKDWGNKDWGNKDWGDRGGGGKGDDKRGRSRDRGGTSRDLAAADSRRDEKRGAPSSNPFARDENKDGKKSASPAAAASRRRSKSRRRSGSRRRDKSRSRRRDRSRSRRQRSRSRKDRSRSRKDRRRDRSRSRKRRSRSRSRRDRSKSRNRRDDDKKKEEKKEAKEEKEDEAKKDKTIDCDEGEKAEHIPVDEARNGGEEKEKAAVEGTPEVDGDNKNASSKAEQSPEREKERSPKKERKARSPKKEKKDRERSGERKRSPKKDRSRSDRRRSRSRRRRRDEADKTDTKAEQPENEDAAGTTPAQEPAASEPTVRKARNAFGNIPATPAPSADSGDGILGDFLAGLGAGKSAQTA